jgi:hypothetical protein
MKTPHIRLSATDISRRRAVDDIVLVVDGIMLVQNIGTDWKRSGYSVPGEGATIHVTDSLCRAGTFVFPDACTESTRESAEVTTSTNDPTCLGLAKVRNLELLTSGDSAANSPLSSGICTKSVKLYIARIKCRKPGNVYRQNTFASSLESD